MTVGELIEGLKKFDPELKVIAAKDDEGNGYHSAYMPGAAFCPELEENWIDTVVPEEYFDDYEEYDLEDRPKVNCVVL